MRPVLALVFCCFISTSSVLAQDTDTCNVVSVKVYLNNSEISNSHTFKVNYIYGCFNRRLKWLYVSNTDSCDQRLTLSIQNKGLQVFTSDTVFILKPSEEKKIDLWMYAIFAGNIESEISINSSEKNICPFTFKLHSNRPELLQLEVVAKVIRESKEVINGIMDAEFLELPAVELKNCLDKEHPETIGTNELSANFRSFWTPGVGIFLFVEVTDDSLVLWNSDFPEKKSDYVEVYFQIPTNWDDDLHSETGEWTFGSFRIRADLVFEQPSSSVGPVTSSFKKSAGLGFEQHITGKGNFIENWKKLQKVESVFKLTDKGYNFEVIYPFEMLFDMEDLGTKPEDLNEVVRSLGFEIVIGDIDNPEQEKEDIISWNQGSPVNKASESINYFGKMTFALEPACCGVPKQDDAGIEKQKLDLLVYPNPFSHKLTLETTEIIKEIELLDLWGRSIIHNSETNKTKMNLNTQNLSKGIYVLKYQLYSGEIGTVKIIKQ